MPYLLLVLTTFFWATNSVLVRGVADVTDPFMTAFLRWGFAFLIVMPFWLPVAKRQWSIIRSNVPILLWLSITGVGAFNTLIYLAVETTTATNVTLLHAFIPVLILLLSRIFFKERVSTLQWLGIISSVIGVVALITQGEPARLMTLHLNPGDLWVLVAVADWAIYSVTLRYMPKGLEPFTFFGLSVLIGTLSIAPFMLVEQGGLHIPQLTTSIWGLMVYIAIFPSILSFSFWNRGVAQLGAATSGLFIYLMPVFGAILSVIVLNESIHGYHLVGISMIILGIWLAIVPRVLAARDQTSKT